MEESRNKGGVIRQARTSEFLFKSNHVLTQAHYDSIKQKMIRRQSK